MVKIRLMRIGKRKQPSYRVVVADSRSPRDGRIIEAIGKYQPRQEPSEISIDTDRAVFWLQQGAQPSEAVKKLLRIAGAWSAFTGEAPLGAEASPAHSKAAPAGAIRATAAASVDDVSGEDAPADLPEAQDQAGVAPDAELEEES
jgi:small subunit ribosomal protein S16